MPTKPPIRSGGTARYKKRSWCWRTNDKPMPTSVFNVKLHSSIEQEEQWTRYHGARGSLRQGYRPTRHVDGLASRWSRYAPGLYLMTGFPGTAEASWTLPLQRAPCMLGVNFDTDDRYRFCYSPIVAEPLSRTADVSPGNALSLTPRETLIYLLEQLVIVSPPCPLSRRAIG